MRAVGDRYVLADPVGSGAMGDVYRATDMQTGESVAIKHLKPELVARAPDMLARFRREGEALRELNHPNIVRMLDAVEVNGDHYLVMEYVAGGDLRGLIAENPGGLLVKQALAIALDLADALTRAHRLEILHRDIKPANVLLAEDGTPRLTDFGIARVGTDSNITASGVVMGTYAYLSPEACMGQTLDERADIWAFGVMLYEMLTGRRPFAGDSPGAIMMATLQTPLPDIGGLRQNIPVPLVDLLYRMLEKDKGERIPSVRLVGAEIEAMLKGITITPTTARDLRPARESAFTISPPLTTRRLHNLPAQPTAFIGREDEVGAISALLAEGGTRLVTLLGPGGIGKTRLSIQVGLGVLEHFGDGVFFVDLATVTDPNMIAGAIAGVLDVRQAGDRPVLESVKDYLSGQQMLLILDNFEQVVEGAGVAAELLEAAPEVKLIVTSRMLLNLRGEHEFLVRTLALPQVDEVSPEALRNYEAARLFIERAEAASARFTVTAENAGIIVEICRRLDGLPLALELAAARIRMLPPAKMLARLENQLKVLTGGARDLPERQRTLRSAIEWSYDLLEEEDRVLFARLAVFAGSFSMEAAEAICAPEGDIDVLFGVERLMDSSLLRSFETEQGDLRFGMLVMIREYALEILEQNGELNNLQAQHANYFAGRSAEFGFMIYSAQAEQVLRWYDYEHGNLLAALAWCEANIGDSPMGLNLLFGMTWFWYRRGLILEGREWADRLLALKTDADRSALWGMALGAGAALATWSGDLDLAIANARESVAILQVADEGPPLAFSVMGVGVVLLNRGLEQEARSYLKTSLAMFREFGVDYFESISLMHLGNVELGIGDAPAASKWLEESYATAQKVGDPWLIASARNNHGEVARVEGNYDLAEVAYRESLEMYRSVGDKGDYARLYCNLGYIAAHKGDLDQARSRFVRSLEMFKILGNKRGIAEVVAGMARLLADEGDMPGATRLLGAAQAIMDVAHAGWWPADRVELARSDAMIRAMLSDEQFKAAWDEGQKLTIDDLFAELL